MTDYPHRYRERYKGVNIDIKARTNKELVEKVKEKKKKIDRGSIDGSMMMSDFGNLFLETNKKHSVSASWYQDLGYTWRTIVKGIGDRPMGNVKPILLQNYLNGLDLADSTIKKRYDLICQIFHHAYLNGVTPTDYKQILVRPAGTPAENGRSITDYERKVLLEVLQGHRGELFCKLILYCGLRPSEVQALIWTDIDLAKRTITVSKSYKRNGSVGIPKTDAAYRTVPIPAHLIPLLKEKHGEPFENLFSHGLTWRRRMWDNVRREMNIAMGCRTYRNKLIPPYPLADDFVLYNLRHTYCTDLEKLGVPINIASRLMGHSNISITSKVYTHASTEALEIARELIDVGNGAGKIAGNR